MSTSENNTSFESLTLSTLEIAERPVIALYCDGGVILRNPSEIGGTFAWAGITKGGCRVIEGSGVIPAPPGRVVTNNQSEYAAAVKALEAMPDGWSGNLCTDSEVTIKRLFSNAPCRNLPGNMRARGKAVLRRLGKITPVLHKGHPSKLDLERGTKNGLPVSIFQVWCDQECGRQAQLYLKSRKA